MSGLMLTAARWAMGRLFATFQKLFRIQNAKELDELGHKSSPAGLMTGSQSSTVIAVEVFEEKDVIPPMRIALKSVGASIDRTPSLFIWQEDPSEPIGNLLAHLE